ncbi:glycoside hydrolase family 16 protein [Rhodotorula graminis WP1]|uniref:Glycoside hydrolase family 16 protein n=1 Tax=Rhodotorula graminis (strain WP1) TaxID=578459 RepID=A0A194SBF4_RHOGW|nr:glycoside hydrolase family 16 protein [Rhodotorula graminis WP1]KPV77932.1 glycoside hydrolase family 16 protein [Rhodotorula graminis WP1]
MYFPAAAILSFSLVLVAPAVVAGKKAKTVKLDVDFSTFVDGSDINSFLDRHQLYVSDYSVGSEPLSHTFVKRNVDIVAGSLRLKVDGQSGSGDVKSAEVGTYDSDIRYGTFTTIAKLTPVEGVCAGFFTYTDDNNEIDIEALSSYYNKGYGYSVQPGLEFTNQPLKAGGKSTNTAVAYDFDPTADFHNYTIVWMKGKSEFHVDGKLRTTFRDNVPSVGASFLWNATSTGAPPMR